jgi:hypothetical protein
VTESKSSLPSSLPTPRGYAAIMVGAGVVAIGAAWLVAGLMDGSREPARLAAVCTGFGALLALAPALFGPRPQIGNWGLVVVGGSMARMILILSLGLMLVPADGTRPFWVGILAGAGLILIAETATAAVFISRLDHARTIAARPGRATPEHA